MAEKFNPQHFDKLEYPERFDELPPAKLIELLELAGAKTLVDFGAGTGMYALAVAEHLPDGIVFAVDEQAELLDRLRAKLAASPIGGRVKPILNDGGRVPLGDGVAERMLMINVLHHVYDQPEVLEEITRLLAPGGLLIVAEFARMERPVGPPSDHVLDLDELRTILTGLGLDERAVHGPGDIGRYHNVIVTQKPPR